MHSLLTLAFLLLLSAAVGCRTSGPAGPGGSAGAGTSTATSPAPSAAAAVPPELARFRPQPAPSAPALLLRPGDQLAICGDSITEQKMYSRVIETYLTVCTPSLNISTRQYGWSGETAPGFLARMTNDCLRFQPTIATTCYGMNDHGYRPYHPDIGARYREASTAIVRAFKGAGARVVLGSPGCVGLVPRWATATNATKEELNLNLCELRNIGLEIARAEQVGFADVFWPMLTNDISARLRFGSDYAVAGKDGVHPGWAGSFVMAHAFLKAFGLDGDLGTFTVDLARQQATATAGHEVVSFDDGVLTVLSRRYPFCAPLGDPTSDNTIRSGMTLVPFADELNRLQLVVRNPKARRYRVTWGIGARTYSAEELRRGINLAREFEVNPFSEAFARVDEAVGAKQAFETKQIKAEFHGPAGKADMEGTVLRTERERLQRVAAVRAAFVPVTHAIRLSPLP